MVLYNSYSSVKSADLELLKRATIYPVNAIIGSDLPILAVKRGDYFYKKNKFCFNACSPRKNFVLLYQQDKSSDLI